MDRRIALKNTALALGYAISGPTLASFLSGCQADPSLDWKPQIFSLPQAKLVAELAETILPRTDTPGAKDVLVDRFMDKILTGAYDIEGQQNFLQGLDAFQKDCKSANGKVFEHCTSEQKQSLLKKLEAASNSTPWSIWGNAVGEAQETPFYRQFKELTVLGYFASEKIGEEVLNYEPIPGRYNGCVPSEKVGKVWSL